MKILVTLFYAKLQCSVELVQVGMAVERPPFVRVCPDWEVVLQSQATEENKEHRRSTGPHISHPTSTTYQNSSKPSSFWFYVSVPKSSSPSRSFWKTTHGELHVYPHKLPYKKAVLEANLTGGEFSVSAQLKVNYFDCIQYFCASLRE